jgi:hypothetical protein
LDRLPGPARCNGDGGRDTVDPSDPLSRPGDPRGSAKLMRQASAERGRPVFGRRVTEEDGWISLEK